MRVRRRGEWVLGEVRHDGDDEALAVGDHQGKRGRVAICVDVVYKVGLEAGMLTDWLKGSELYSSGLNETEFLVRAMEGCADEVREECESLPQQSRDVATKLRECATREGNPLLSVLQVSPLQLQAPLLRQRHPHAPLLAFWLSRCRFRLGFGRRQRLIGGSGLSTDMTCPDGNHFQFPSRQLAAAPPARRPIGRASRRARA